MTLREKIKITIRGYKTIHQLTPGFLPAVVCQAAAQALLPLINIYMSARVITALTAGEELNTVLTLAFATVALNFIVGLAEQCLNRLCSYQNQKFYTVMDKPLDEKIRQMDYEHVENTETHLKYSRILQLRQTNGFGLMQLHLTAEGMLRSFFSVIFSAALIAGAFTTQKTADAGFWNILFTPWASIITILFTAAVIWLETKRIAAGTRKTSEAFMRVVPLNRIGMYYGSYLLNYKAGKDLKIYRLYPVIFKEYSGIMKIAHTAMTKFYGLTARYQCLVEVLNMALQVYIYGFVSLKAIFGGIAIGGIVQYVGALSQFTGGISALIGGVAILLINADSLALFYEFTDMPDIKYHGSLTTEKRADNDYEIAFKNVSFRYPGSEKYALRGLNLNFKVGRRMAVVGMNGSGKTTMIKLLCRLYDPTEGEITLNGVDIRKYQYQEYMELFSVVFQDFKLFSFSLGQNVAARVHYDAEKAEECLEKAGFKARLDTLPQKLDTPLYKDFEEDGVEISGGEAQKIALARALYRNAPFVVLDEPTAALDPLAEYEVYARFNEIARDKTTVFISHRLSSCRFCDDIAVFHEGRLVQRGGHDKLLADKHGKYFELWEAQAQYYSHTV